MNWNRWKLHPVRRSSSHRDATNRWRPRVESLESRELLSFRPTNVVTYHNDLLRTGADLTETILRPHNVQPGKFGRLYSYPVDGQIYATPLYMSGLTFPDGSVHNTVFVATEHDSVYAFDANGGGLLWQTPFIDPTNGITPFSQSDALGCGQITPELGVTATPVIDPNTGIMYVVDQFKQVVGGNTTYHQQLHALDITTGYDVLSPVEITGSVINDSGRTVNFDPHYYKERAALTLVNGVLYTAWASHCDITPSNGWVMGYDPSSLTQLSVFNTSPNGSLDTIWQGNGGLASDGTALYFETGNGTNILGHGDDYSEAFMKLDLSDGQTVDDYFIPANFQALDSADRDIGSGAPIALPDQPGDHPHLLVGGGKDGRIFLMDRDNMGKLNNPPNGPDLVLQTVPNALSGGSWDTPAYFDAGDPNGPFIYYVGNGDRAKAFQLQNGLLTTSPTSQSPTAFSGSYGASPIVTANHTKHGIVWALENRGGNLVLHAYDATNLGNELYNSNNNVVPNDRMGAGVKFATPSAADGKVFVPTASSLEIFGLFRYPGASGVSDPGDDGTDAVPLNPGLTPAVVAGLVNAPDVSRSVVLPTPVLAHVPDLGINANLTTRVQADTGSVAGDGSLPTSVALQKAAATEPALPDATLDPLTLGNGLS